MTRNIQEPFWLAVSLSIAGFGIAALSSSLNWNQDTFTITSSLYPVLIGVPVMIYWWIRVEADAQAHRIKTEQKIKHTLSWAIRAAVAVGISLLIHAHSFHWVKVLNLTLYQGFFFGIVFNWTLNHKINKPTFYLGVDHKEGSKIDNWFNNFKYGGQLLFLLYGLGLIAAGYVYLQQ